MTWREQTVVRILLLVAKIVDEGPWHDDLQREIAVLTFVAENRWQRMEEA